MIEILEDFFSLIDSAKLFESTDPEFYRSLRKKISDALYRILVWERPNLEATKGLLWPYDELRKRVNNFEQTVYHGNNVFIKNQARFFLALLPFPGQWRWLITIQKDFRNNPEISNFLKKEKKNILDKLAQKNQQHFKLRHFCQILKKPRLPAEKGILRIFSLPYIFVDQTLLQSIANKYFLYVEPPMGVIFRHNWWRVFCQLDTPCLFGLGSHEDTDFLRTQPGILATNLAHGDFLKDNLPIPTKVKKSFDIVFNSSFDDMPRKRHEFMLTLLAHPLLRNKTVLFLGRGNETEVEKFKTFVHEKGLGNRVTIRANLLRRDIPGQLVQCRIGVHLSLYENACRSIYEFFRSGLPCVVSSATAGMNPDIFNPQTGMAVMDSKLPETIDKVLGTLKTFTPRKWFQSNSGSSHSTKKLNQQLKSIFYSLGYPWNEDIALLSSSGASRYANKNQYEFFRSEFRELLECFRGYPELSISLSAEN